MSPSFYQIFSQQNFMCNRMCTNRVYLFKFKSQCFHICQMRFDIWFWTSTFKWMHSMTPNKNVLIKKNTNIDRMISAINSDDCAKIVKFVHFGNKFYEWKLQSYSICQCIKKFASVDAINRHIESDGFLIFFLFHIHIWNLTEHKYWLALFLSQNSTNGQIFNFSNHGNLHHNQKWVYIVSLPSSMHGPSGAVG